MRTTIYCKRSERGMHNFYLRINGEEFYLFSQNFKKGVQDYFGRGVYLEYACDYSRSKHDTAVMKTMDKIPIFIKYVEKESGILVFEKSKKKQLNQRKYYTKVAYCA